MELMVKIDNTFDIINWNGKISSSITEWNQYQGKSQLAIWYNRQAHSENEKQMIKDFQISKLAIDRIEKLLVDYLGRTINVR